MNDKEDSENNIMETDGNERGEDEEAVGVSQEIYAHPLNPDVSTFYQQWKDGDLIVNPEFR